MDDWAVDSEVVAVSTRDSQLRLHCYRSSRLVHAAYQAPYDPSCASPRPETQRVRVFKTHTVGVNYYPKSKRLCKNSMVLLAREKDNVEDANAVRVADDDLDMVGYLPREEACHLAPLMDEELIHLGGVVVDGARVYRGRRDAVATILAVEYDQADEQRVLPKFAAGGMHLIPDAVAEAVVEVGLEEGRISFYGRRMQESAEGDRLLDAVREHVIVKLDGQLVINIRMTGGGPRHPKRLPPGAWSPIHSWLGCDALSRIMGGQFRVKFRRISDGSLELISAEDFPDWYMSGIKRWAAVYASV